MIGIDWGTSSFRAYRLAPEGTVREHREAPLGILAVPNGDFAAALDGAVGDWIAAGETELILAGMIGSRQGWVEAPYCPCPAGAVEIAAATIAIPHPRARIRLVPGLSARDPAGVPEVMRGEETQILGVLDVVGDAPATLCLPGSHAKWVQVERGRIQGFATHFTGEAFAALSQHTILARTIAAGGGHDPAAFARGIARAKQPGGLLHHLFGLRASALFGEIAESEAASFLSGLLIGHEVAAALEAGVAPPIHLIASEALAARYAAALDDFGIPHRAHAPDAAARGLFLIAERLA